MGDQGNAAASGRSSSSLDQLFSDASLGASLTGDQTGADLLSGTSSADLSTLFADAGLGSALLGDSSGLGGAFSTATDPSGSAAASLATNPPADTAGTPAGSDPSGNIGGTQSGGAPQPNAPQPQPQQTPPAAQQKQPESPLTQIAKALGGAFGLGAKPTAGGPTGMTPQPGAGEDISGQKYGPSGSIAAPAGGLPSAIANILPTMPTPANTGALPYGYGGSPNQPARPVTPTPQAPGAIDPTILAGGPGAGAAQLPAAQPPAAAAKPDPAPATAPAAPAAPAPASADLPTRKGPETPEAAPEPSQGVYGPTGGAGGMPAILRDILGLALPLALPMLAMGLMGGRGRGRGGIPPWAMHGMMPFMRGTRNGFVGFRGGFLRPGYYPMRQGGWGFHGGGYHPGWGAWAPGVVGNQPMALAAAAAAGGALGGAEAGGWRGANVQSGGPAPSAGADQAWTGSGLSSNPFLNTLVGQESGGGQNIVSRTDKDSRGLTLAQGGNPAEISQGYFQIQNHPGGTWSTYARQAGVDLAKYPTPRSAPLEVQWEVASRIPIREWGPDTQVALQRRGFRYSPEMTLGQVAQANGGVSPTAVASNPSSSTSRGAPGTPRANIRITDPDNPEHDYPAKTETSGAPAPPPVQSDDFASAG